jgi:hypothetical protein
VGLFGGGFDALAIEVENDHLTLTFAWNLIFGERIR